jgi:hypothetical protein
MNRILAITVILIVILLWVTRFSIYEASGIGVYKLDRWTGKITVIAGIQEMAIISK